MTKSKKSEPLITVLMAVYNGERWLHDSINSILDQTYTNFEFIIINDGSTDNSPQIINKFAFNDSRITIYNKKNSGLTDSLNFGIQKAKGKWIARIDADDISSPCRLKKQLERTFLDDDIVLVGSGLIIIDENGERGKAHTYSAKSSILKQKISKGLPFFPHSSAFFKLNIAVELGGYRSQFIRSQDQDLWLRLAQVGEIGCIKEPLVLLRKHDQQISLDNSGQRQFTFSHMAMTSYFLRCMGQADPMEKIMEKDVDYFFRFILTKLEEQKFFEHQAYLHKFKIKLSKANSIISKFNILLKSAIFTPNFLYRYIKYRFIGSGLPIKFAYDWIRLTQKK
jgi:glycosyltransferase involved in cell wall biosynthesis